MEVLQGFRESFARDSIDVLQFDFTLWAAIARRWLANYYDFFSQWESRVGRLSARSIRLEGLRGQKTNNSFGATS